MRGLTLDHVADDKLARIDFDNLRANVSWNAVAKSEQEFSCEKHAANLAIAYDVCARWSERLEACHDSIHLRLLIEGKQACAEHHDDKHQAEVDGLIVYGGGEGAGDEAQHSTRHHHELEAADQLF